MQGDRDSTSKIESDYPPPLMNTKMESGAKYSDRRKVVIRKWMFALSFLLLVPFAAWIALEVGPIGLTKFLQMTEDRDVAGTAYWSLFGRDDACCKWVEHVSLIKQSVEFMLGQDIANKMPPLNCLLSRMMASRCITEGIAISSEVCNSHSMLIA